MMQILKKLLFAFTATANITVDFGRLHNPVQEGIFTWCPTLSWTHQGLIVTGCFGAGTKACHMSASAC